MLQEYEVKDNKSTVAVTAGNKAFIFWRVNIHFLSSAILALAMADAQADVIPSRLILLGLCDWRHIMGWCSEAYASHEGLHPVG